MLNADLFKKNNNSLPFVFLLVLVFVVLKLFMLSNAFHVDTMLYVDAVRAFIATGKIPEDFFFLHRIVNVWLYLPFYYFFKMPGVAGATLLFYLLFGVFYMRVVKEIFNAKTALFSFLLLTFTPAALITVTHLKEDFNALLFLFASLSLLLSLHRKDLKKQALFCFFSGIVFSLGLLAKDTLLFLGILPLLLIGVDRNKILFRRNSFFNYICFVMGVILLLLLLCPAYLTQVLRLFNDAQIYRLAIFSLEKNLWKHNSYILLKSLLHVWWLIPLFFYGVYDAVKTKQLRRIGFAFVFTVYLFFLGGSNGFRMRLGFWLGLLFIPTAVYALFETVSQRFKLKIFFMVGLLLISISNFIVVYPLLDLRSKVNFVEIFYSEAAKKIPEGSLVIGMDTLDVLKFFAGDKISYQSHPLNPLVAEIDKFISDLKVKNQEGVRIFVLPDFFNYGGSNVNYLRQELFAAFKLSESYLGFYSMYHHMDYFVKEDSYVKTLQAKIKTGTLKILDKGEIPLNNSAAKIVIKECIYQDLEGKQSSIIYYVYKNIVLPLRTAKVYELIA